MGFKFNSQAVRKSWSNPVTRARRIRSLRNAWKDQESRTRRIKVFRKAVNKPSVRKRWLRRLREACKDPERNLRISKARKLVKIPKAVSRMGGLSRKGKWTKEQKRERSLHIRQLMRTAKWQKAQTLSLKRQGRLRRSEPQITIFRRLCRSGISGLRLDLAEGRFLIDIAHLPTKTAIESDGDYFHKDRCSRRRRDRFLKRHGWTVIHVRLNNRKEARDLDISCLTKRLLKRGT